MTDILAAFQRLVILIMILFVLDDLHRIAKALEAHNKPLGLSEDPRGDAGRGDGG